MRNIRRGARVAEWARLEIACSVTRNHGFESHPLRHLVFKMVDFVKSIGNM